jgi:hypothetical protein
MTFREAYEKYGDTEFLKFEEVKIKFSNRRDLHAFILLDKWSSKTTCIVAAAEHDEIYLDFDGDFEASESELIELIRCGVRYDSCTGSLAMFT